MPSEVNLINQADYKQKTKNALKDYFYAEGGLCDHLRLACKRLEKGEKPPLFSHSLDIFGASKDEDKKTDLLSLIGEGSFTSAQKAEIIEIVQEVLIGGIKPS